MAQAVEEGSRDGACAVHDHHDLDAVRNRSVQDHVVAVGKRTDLGIEVVADLPDQGAVSEHVELLIEGSNEVVCRSHVVLGDVVPDFVQISLGTGSVEKHAHSDEALLGGSVSLVGCSEEVVRVPGFAFPAVELSEAFFELGLQFGVLQFDLAVDARSFVHEVIE